MEQRHVIIGTVVPKCRCIKRSQKHSLGTMEFDYFLPRSLQVLGCPPGLEHNSRSILGKIQLLFYLLSFTLHLFLATKRHRPHLIHANWAIPSGLVSWIVGRMTRTPVLVTVLGADVYQKGFRKQVIRFVLERVDHVVVVSSHVKRLLVGFAKPKKLTVIPNAIDVRAIISAKEKANLHAVKKRLGLRADDRTVVTVRRLVVEKRVQDLVKAAAQVLQSIKGVVFLIGGYGPELESLRELTRTLDIESNVRFLGPLSEEEKLELLSIADLCVQTSVQEGLSLALLEFMASGAVVIASAAAGQSDVIEAGVNGLLFPAADTDALANCIVQALQNDEYQNLGPASREYVLEHHSFEAQVERYMSVYREFRT